MVKGEPRSPEWKILWDQARQFSREKNYSQAVEAYQQLYQQKPNIAEASWEYTKVLQQLGDYALAGKVLGGLLERDPGNSDYLLAAGTIAEKANNYEEAIRFFGQVLEKAPAGPGADTALMGMANSLRNQGKKQFSFSLLEQYSLRHPKDQRVLEYLAEDALELGRSEKARQLYTLLLERSVVEDRILFFAAAAFDEPGFEKTRNGLWLNYLERHPDYLPFRKNLLASYLAGGEFTEALKQLNYLADNVKDNEEYLLQAADLCRYELNRADKALQFLERYKAKHPASRVIKRKISDVQRSMAQNFLVLVENDRALQLWRDLAKITVNREAVFFKIADLLEKKGRAESLIEVLEILYSDGFASNDLSLRLAAQYRGVGRFDKALLYLNKVGGSKSRNKSFLLLKADTELQLGFEMDALVSLERALKLTPKDINLRTRCIKLAGTIGNTDKLQSFFEEGLKTKEQNVPPDFIFNYLRVLKFNHLFLKYEKVFNSAKKLFRQSPDLLRQLDIDRAGLLGKKGDLRQAEQLLRQLLVNNPVPDNVLAELVDISLKEGKFEKAEYWYSALEKMICNESIESSCFTSVAGGDRLLLLKTQLLQRKGKFAAALKLLDEFFSVEKITEIDRNSEIELQLKKMRCWLNYSRENYNDAFIQFVELYNDSENAENRRFDPEMWLLADKLKIRLPAKDKTRLSDINRRNNRLFIGGKPVLSHLIVIAEKEMQMGDYQAAQKHAESVLKNFPESVVAKNLWVESMIGQGKAGRCLETLSQLLDQFPGEDYYTDKQIDIETRRGGYSEGLRLLSLKVEDDANHEQVIERLLSTGDLRDKLRLARLLWGDKQQERSLEIYQKLLQKSVLEELSEKFRMEDLNPPYSTRDKTLWKSMLLMLQSEPKLLEELMAPPFLLENLDNKTGEIVAGFFAEYSWQKLIKNEYEARKAIYDRNYYYAEQSYKRLMEEEPQEGMLDLATVYGKIGKYRKEAQLYQEIRESGASSPELAESIERNSLQLSPKNIFMLSYWEQEGRDDNIDMAKLSLGAGFEFTPDLDMDFRLIYENNRFESVNGDREVKSDLMYGLVTYEFIKGYELIFGAGVEKLSGDMDSGYQYKLELTGQLDDNLDAYLRLEKKQVYDTLFAIEEQVTFQAVEAGLNFETPIGLSIGGDLQHRYYNDGNAQNRFHGYSAYTIFGESLRLGLRYDYQYLVSDDDNGPGSGQQTDKTSDRLYYWSPSSLSEHRVGVTFQQDFLGFEEDSKKSMSYWTVDSGLGVEDNKNLIFTTKLDIFLEMSPHFLLKGNFTLSQSDDYEEKGVSLSLNYRW